MATVRELRAKFVAEARNMKKAFQDVRKSASDLAKNNTIVGKSWRAVNDGTDATVKKIKAANGQIYALNRTASQTQKTFKTTGASISAIGKNFSAAEVKAASLTRSVKNTGGQMESTKKNVSKLDKSITGFASTAKDGAGTVRKSFNSIPGIVQNTAGKIKSGVKTGIIMPFREAASAVKGYAGVLGLLGAGSLASAGMGRLSAIENAQVSLEVMMGDAKKAKGFLDDVLAFAKTTPFAFPDLAASARNLVAFGMDAEKVVPTLQAIGDAAAGSGKGSEGLNQIADAFGAIQVSSNLSMEEVNRLMSNGVPALKILANQYGITADEMKKRISDGSVESSEAIDKLVEGMQKGTKGVAGETASMAGLMEKMKGTWTGSVDSLKSSISSTMATLMKPAKPHIQNFMKWFGDQFSKLPDLFKRIGEATKPAREAIKALFEAFKGKDDKASDILSRLGVPPGLVQKIINGINLIQHNLSRARDFISDTFVKIKEYWNKNGQQTMEAAQNAFNVFMAVVRFVMPFVLGIIKSVWGNITGVIKGAIKVIDGIIKVFTGLFTGDFKKMWEGVKQIFFGAIQFVWNYVQLLFIGRILKGAKAFIGAFRSGFASMWQGVKSLFAGGVKNAWELIKKGWNTIWTATKTIFNNIWNFLKNTWNSIKSITTGAINLVRSIIVNGWNFIKSTTTTTFKNIWGTIKSIWTNVRDFISRTVSNVWTRIRDTWSNIKNSTFNTFRNIYNSIRDRFTNIVELAKGLPKRIGDGIGKMASKVKDGVTKVINKLASTLGKGVNGVIGGINWVLERIGVKSRVPEWKVPKYAKGTDGHPQDGPAIVGDGKGSNAGQELIQTPDGQTYLSPGQPTVVYLPKGTHVWSALETKEILNSIPEYGWGTVKKVAKKAKGAAKGGLKKVGNVIKKGAKSVKDTALNVFDYISNPGKLLNKALEMLGVSSTKESGLVGDIARAGFKKIKDGAVDFIKKKLEDFTSSVPSAGSGVKRWAGVAARALMMTGQYSKANLDRLLYQMQTESGGNPRAINLWDINAKRGTPSKGLMQVIDPTFRAYAMPGFNTNIWDPLSNILASIRYAVSRYGSLARAYRGVGYADGGIVDRKQLAWIAEGGWAESIISHDPAKRLSQRAIWEKTGQMLGFDSGNDEVISLLMRIAEAVEAGQDLAVIMNDQVVGRILEPIITKLQGRKNNRSRRTPK